MAYFLKENISTGLSGSSRFDYLTSRRYPYNKTMTELVDEIRREQHVDKLLNETTSTPRYWNDAPRVVETSYYDMTVFKCDVNLIKHLMIVIYDSKVALSTNLPILRLKSHNLRL